ncbi:hypothetical protein JAAARDRAFT_62868 [Jaapia argillacea MUCL 33604]|uniref:F-box domain-containing protein n=1 Tax=Jaapia argillacea MUCL 33604 TaxID=933084 RepID=A0A067P7Y0_9AGAM|nr:hypothetical protein JAAARDRAFT_62868 [Jaapia argillacea MUCL 33604]
MSRQVFLIEELCREICCFIDPIEDPACLVRLARCSRSLLNPALDVLWKEMYSMGPLMELIPVVNSKMGPYSNTTITYYLSQPPQAEDWVRFDFYAHRIRTLYYEHGYRTDGDCKIYGRLAQCRPHPMFPNLRSLVWHHDAAAVFDTSFIEEVSYFLLPSLRELSMGTQVWDYPAKPDRYPAGEAAEAFMLTLTRQCPLLESLELQGQIQDMSFSSIRVFRNLQSLNLSAFSMDRPYADIDFLSALSDLPCLHSISGLDAEVAGSSVQIGFPALRSLAFGSVNPTGLIIILRAITSTSFKSLSIDSFLDSSQEDISTPLAILSSFAQLEEIYICFLPWRPKYVVPPIEWFFCLGHLRKVILRTHDVRKGWPTMDFVLSERIALAWPQLEELSLQCPFRITSLKPLALLCPNLTTLACNALITQDDEDDLTNLTQDAPVLSHPLHNLNLDYYLVPEDYRLIAAVLGRLFPHLVIPTPIISKASEILPGDLEPKV